MRYLFSRLVCLVKGHIEVPAGLKSIDLFQTTCLRCSAFFVRSKLNPGERLPWDGEWQEASRDWHPLEWWEELWKEFLIGWRNKEMEENDDVEV